MRIHHLKKYTILVLTLWPLFYLIISLVLFSQLYDFQLLANGSPEVPTPFLSLESTIVFHAISLIEIIGILVFYLFYLTMTDRVKSGRKPIWGISLLFGHFVAMIIFYYIYIWNGGPETDEY